nr:C4 protein [African cassava mosaic virus]
MPFRDNYIMSPINRRRCSRVSPVEFDQVNWRTCEVRFPIVMQLSTYFHALSVLWERYCLNQSQQVFFGYQTLRVFITVILGLNSGTRSSHPSSNSRAKSRLRTIVSSIAYTQAVAPVSTPTFKVPNPAQMSSPIWIRTATLSNGDNFRSMDDLLEEVNNQRMMLTPKRLTAAVSPKLLM